MAFARPSKTKTSTQLAKSTWTPLNQPEANSQVFEERREILQKWFQKWHEPQKKIIVDDILKNLSTKHLVKLSETLKGKFPQEKHDFTKVLPRVLTLYLFSFLDPRTLCRCAQVSWYWNYLTEMDCLWRPKCLKFGWYPTYEPTPFEQKVWKRFYVTTVHDLNYVKAKGLETTSIANHISNLEITKGPDTSRSRYSNTSRPTSSMGIRKGPSTPVTKKALPGPKWEPPPWKGSDPRPTDTMRYNYLDNSSRGKKKKSSGLPDSRPSSRNITRPQSALSKSRSETKGKHINGTNQIQPLETNGLPEKSKSQQIEETNKENAAHSIVFTNISTDVTAHPPPVRKYTPKIKSPELVKEAIKSSELIPVKTNKSIPISNTNQLEGRKWKPPESDSEDEF